MNAVKTAIIKDIRRCAIASIWPQLNGTETAKTEKL